MNERLPYPGDFAPDYTEDLKQYIDELKLPEGAVSEPGLLLMNKLLRDIYYLYGDEDSENYHAYHNDMHGKSVIRNAWQILTIIREVAPEKVGLRDFEIAGIAAAGHDYYQDFTEYGRNELESARIVDYEMEAMGYAAEDRRRAVNAITATIVSVEDGKVQQVHVRSNPDKDPVVLAVATGDVNGIAINGIPAMARDVLNLVAERQHTRPLDLRDPTAVVRELRNQVVFLGNRLDVVEPDLAAYFSPDEVKEIRKLYNKKFGKVGSEAIRVASKMAKFYPAAADVVNQMMSGQAQTAIEMTEALTRGLRRWNGAPDATDRQDGQEGKVS